MAYSFKHTNPRLTGVLIKEKVRCGKPNCRCMRHNRLHQWYYYLYWRDYGVLRKEYVPRAELVKLRRKIKTVKTKDMEEKANLKLYLKLLSQFNKK